MRGSPIWQAILIVVVFALAGVPVWRLTQPSPGTATSATSASTPSASPADGTARSVEVEALFAPPPADFQIKYLGQSILEGCGPASSFNGHWATAMPTEGVDLVVQARWNVAVGTPPSVSPSAVRVTVRFADGRQVEKSFWSNASGSLAEVFTVPGSSAAPVP